MQECCPGTQTNNGVGGWCAWSCANGGNNGINMIVIATAELLSVRVRFQRSDFECLVKYPG